MHTPLIDICNFLFITITRPKGLSLRQGLILSLKARFCFPEFQIARLRGTENRLNESKILLFCVIY